MHGTGQSRLKLMQSLRIGKRVDMPAGPPENAAQYSKSTRHCNNAHHAIGTSDTVLVVFAFKVFGSVLLRYAWLHSGPAGETDMMLGCYSNPSLRVFRYLVDSHYFF
ncbi:MAG: hypothetical protein RLZZ303_2917 [Candidatus Hydrogenedentota bacterium]|jgi:hypothetical protein